MLLWEFVLEAELQTVKSVFADEATGLAGPKGRRLLGRTAHHGGTAPAELVIGGGTLALPWPRVRSVVPSRAPDELDVAFLMLDDIVVKKQGVAVAPGATVDGTKQVLGRRLGSTENAALCTLVVFRLRLQRALTRSLSTTNAVENLLSALKSHREIPLLFEALDRLHRDRISLATDAGWSLHAPPLTGALQYFAGHAPASADLSPVVRSSRP